MRVSECCFVVNTIPITLPYELWWDISGYTIYIYIYVVVYTSRPDQLMCEQQQIIWCCSARGAINDCLVLMLISFAHIRVFATMIFFPILCSSKRTALQWYGKNKLNWRCANMFVARYYDMWIRVVCESGGVHSVYHPSDPIVRRICSLACLPATTRQMNYFAKCIFGFIFINSKRQLACRWEWKRECLATTIGNHIARAPFAMDMWRSA